MAIVLLVAGVLFVVWLMSRGKERRQLERRAEEREDLENVILDRSDDYALNVWTFNLPTMRAKHVYRTLDGPGVDATVFHLLRRLDGPRWEWRLTDESYVDDLQRLHEQTVFALGTKSEALADLAQQKEWRDVGEQVSPMLETRYARYTGRV